MEKNRAMASKAELEKALLLLDRAIQNNRLCGVERDMILEYLRRVYDAVLFSKVTPEVGAAMSEDTEDYPGELWKEIVSFQSEREEDIEEEAAPESEPIPEDIPPATNDLNDQPFHSVGIDRSIIETLYEDSSLCRKSPSEDVPAQEEVPLTVTPGAVQQELEAGRERVLNETLGGAALEKDIASMLSAQTVDCLRNAISLNHQLMLMRDLFDGDMDAYEKTLVVLDSCDNIDDACIYLYEHFTMDDTKEGVKYLISLLETKFS